MKIIFILLGIFILLPQLTMAEELEWARKARERGPSPATKAAYDKVVAEQAAKKEVEAQQYLQQQEAWKKLEVEQAEIDAQIAAAEEVRQKQCGKDYGQVKVGMKLSRIQKCTGEFNLHGQVKWNKSIVDYYTRGDVYLYVKNGKVVAWGE